jgi:hypothetical protein
MFEMLFSNLFVFYGIIFVLFLVGTIFAEVDDNSSTFPFVPAICSAIFYFFLGRTDFYQYFDYSALQFAILGVVYLIVGSVWSFIKWYMYSKNKLPAYKRELEYELKKYEVSSFRDLNDEDKKKVEKELSGLIPKVTNNKSRVISWIVYWPLSIVRYIFTEFLYDMFSGIFNLIKDYFQSVTNNMYNKANNDV